MPPAFWRMIWTFVLVVIAVFIMYMIAGNLIPYPRAVYNNPVMIDDDLEGNTHHLSGRVYVPSSCDELAATAEHVSSSTVIIDFTTWEEPSIPCVKRPIARDFSITAFGPPDTAFVAELNNGPVSISILPRQEWVNSSTSIILVKHK